MKLEGRLFVANRMTEIREVTTEDTDPSYSKRLEKALIELCRQMDIPVPMWMKKNTKEFAAFGQTIFFREQYTEKFALNHLFTILLKDTKLEILHYQTI